MPRAAPEVTRRELLVLVLGACLLAIVMHWPLILHMGQDIPKDVGDPLVQSWQVAWDGHALLHQPLDFFQSNQFWPLDNTLALSDALVGYAPAGLIGSGTDAAVFRYDALFLFAYALAFVGAYLLARELGIGRAGAVVAGAAFAFAPYRLEQDGHMHVISSGGIALALAVGLRGYRLERPGWVIAGWAIAAWQLSLGWTLGLPLAYLLMVMLAIWAIVWVRRGRPGVARRLLVATAVGGAIFIATAAILSRPYLQAAEDNPEARRTPGLVQIYSGPASIFLTAPAENLVWGGATADLRDDISGVAEKTLFPGLVIVVLAAIGLGSSTLPPPRRWALVAVVVGFSVLALGFQQDGGLLYPYRWVYDFLPGWDAIRVPGRLFTFASLGLALLAAAGAEATLRAATRRVRSPWAAVAVPAVLALAIVIEGRGLPFDPFNDQAQPRVPSPPATLASVPAPQLHLPATRPRQNRRYLLWSTDGFPALVNGRSSTNPVFTQRLIDRVGDFPDRRSVDLLARLGVRSVVVHPTLANGTLWSHAIERPIAGLPLHRQRDGNVVIYEIEPESSAGSSGGTRAERSSRNS